MYSFMLSTVYGVLLALACKMPCIYVKLRTILTTVYIITCFKLNAVNEIIVETFAFSLLYE